SSNSKATNSIFAFLYDSSRFITALCVFSIKGLRTICKGIHGASLSMSSMDMSSSSWLGALLGALSLALLELLDALSVLSLALFALIGVLAVNVISGAAGVLYPSKLSIDVDIGINEVEVKKRV